jgi:acyl carrier protein
MAGSVEEKVKQIIVEQLGVDESEVTATASFVDDLGFIGYSGTGHGF